MQKENTTAEKENGFFTESKKTISDYVHDRILLIKLEMVEKMSKLLSTMFIGLLITILGLFILLFLSFMAGYYFAAVTNSLYLGFGIVCGFYVLLLVFMVSFGKKILHTYIANTVIETIFDQTAEEEDDTDNEENKTQ